MHQSNYGRTDFRDGGPGAHLVQNGHVYIYAQNTGSYGGDIMMHAQSNCQMFSEYSDCFLDAASGTIWYTRSSSTRHSLNDLHDKAFTDNPYRLDLLDKGLASTNSLISDIIHSDDRLKHNEEPLDDALSLIRQLSVQTYDQTQKPIKRH